MTRYMRVKSKATGNEFDLPKASFDPEKYSRVSRYADTDVPRRPKIKVNLAEGRRINPVKTNKE